ncbi:hypothetical protein ACFOY2_11330 [Nonomuraea purpurea]|uniref:Transposase n=1 Tax=Nonomuraea purpurea TaxID=1849276 RepID=A0ABV8G1E6_9ACTN
MADHLRHLGIESRISACEGIALVGIWSVGLTVWCECVAEGWRFRWCVNGLDERSRWRYTSCPATAVETAALRIERLYRSQYLAIHGDVPTEFQ